MWACLLPHRLRYAGVWALPAACAARLLPWQSGTLACRAGRRDALRAAPSTRRFPRRLAAGRRRAEQPELS